MVPGPGGFDLKSLEHFQGSVVYLSDFPWTAFSKKSSANNQTESYKIEDLSCGFASIQFT
jgi:hypothetical protein